MKIKCLILTLGCLLSFGITQAQNLPQVCKLIGYADCKLDKCDNVYVFEERNNTFVKVHTLQPMADFKFYRPLNGSAFHAIAPNGKRVAIAEISTADPLPIEAFVAINVFDITESITPVEEIFDTLFASGSVWSHDSSKFISVDAWGHYRPSLSDLKRKTGGELWPAPPLRDMRAYEVVWSPDDELLAVMGEEYPFPVSQNAINDVKTLYVARIVPGEAPQYVSISSPEVNATNDFVWLSNERILFTTYRYNRKLQTYENQYLNIATIDGKSEWTVEGIYRVYGKFSGNEALVSQSTDKNFKLLKLDFQSRKFTLLIEFPTEEVGTYPFFKLSPNSRFIYYTDKTGRAFVANMADATKSHISVPISQENPGLWSPDGNSIAFYEYNQNIVYRYAADTQTLVKQPVEEAFPGLDKPPLYPTWMCPK